MYVVQKMKRKDHYILNVAKCQLLQVDTKLLSFLTDKENIKHAHHSPPG